MEFLIRVINVLIASVFCSIIVTKLNQRETRHTYNYKYTKDNSYLSNFKDMLIIMSFLELL